MLTDDRVLYEDNHLIAVFKYPSDIVQGDKTGDKPLSEIVKEYLKLKYSKPGAVYLGVIHRIDRPVSGVVLFAKTSKALSRMNKMFQEKSIQKTYWAVVKNAPPAPSGTLKHYLRKDQKRNKSLAYKKTTPDAKESILNYQLIASSDKYHLLEIDPKTGRHHQIRVQLSAMGCPIKGDLKYGFDRSNPNASIHLHARKVVFEHPVKKEKMIITCPTPPDNLWDAFLTII